MKTKPRIFQYDFIRAFAIVTVVASHVYTTFDKTPFEFEVKEYLNTILRFSVPLFIFLSGVLFRRNIEFGHLKKKLLRIIIPYTVLSIPATIFLCWKFEWTFQNLPEIISSYLFGYKFGFYFIFIILFLYIIGYFLVRSKFVKNMDKVLLMTFVIHAIWLIADEFIYEKIGLREINILQFNLNDFIFYRNPFTWVFFFILGLWYQDEKSKQLVSKSRKLINISLILIFVFYNLQIFFKFGGYTPYGSVIWSLFSTTIILFLLNLKVEKFKESKIINYLSNHSFSIFLIHYLLLYIFAEIDRLTKINVPYIANTFLVPLIFLISISLIELGKKLLGKKAMYLIGV